MLFGVARALVLVASLAPVAAAAPAQESAAIQPDVPATSDRAVIERARVLKRPEYPADAIAGATPGIVAVRFLVTANGEIVNARAVSGPEQLRRAAVKAARAWEFNSSKNPNNLTGFIVFKFTPGIQYADILGLREQEIALSSEPEPIPPPPVKVAAVEPVPPPVQAPASAPPAGPIAVSTSDLLANAENKVAPPYPPAAANARIEGTVMVSVLVDEQGRVVEAEATSGHVLLREAAVAAAREWTFKPSLSGDKPVKVRSTIVFLFRR